ncbi:MAG: VOC family protein [Proteobacteria bacterium]|nr:VOC family protein [Pseudomonadota bacterium]
MIKVTDVAHARFTAPDLDVMETFLVDFGLTRSARTDDTLYMRGTDPDHHLHITHLADKPSFVGMAFQAASMEDLETLSKADGASAVEEIDEPGGGYRVRMTDPNGYQVETVFGIETVDPLPLINRFEPNFGSARSREGELVRLKKAPCQVKRLGHVVLNVPSCEIADKFYKEHFGFISSDECFTEDGTELAVAFNRCDKGKDFVDHHTLLTVRSQVRGLAHIAFEVEDINALYVGKDYLESKGYEHSWGVGRHTLGSQIFDYWFDPYGNRVEHWTDGDLLNVDNGTKVTPLSVALATQWGVTVADRRASLETDYDPLSSGS